MDGNGRWAKQQGAARIFGHRNAIQAVRDIVEGCAEVGVGFLTLYAFSTENWERPKMEVDALMELLVHTIRNELPILQKNNIRLSSVGDQNNLPRACRAELHEATNATVHNTGLTLTLALSYSGKWDLTEAARALARQVQAGTLAPEAITEQHLARHLPTAHLPDADLMIRTGGDHRISNFMLWQLAYAELFVFDDVFWPDFRKPHLHRAILSYQQRERRFGKISEQVQS